jgi:hypothetical protein
VKKLRFKNISEKIIVFFVILFALFLAKFPSLYHAMNTPPGYWFVGHTSWFDGWDIQVYLSAIRYGEHSGVFLQNAYTTVPHQGEFIYQFYTFLGVLNRFLHTTPIVLFQAASVIASIILISVLYVIVRFFFKERAVRLTAFATAVLGGGFGWIQQFGNAADLQSAGLTTVNSFERGHDAISTACLLLSFYLFIRFTRVKNKRLLVWAVLLGLVNCVIHPVGIIMYAIGGSFLAVCAYFQSRHTSVFLYPLLIIGLFGLYYFVFLSGLPENQGFSGIVSQGMVPVDPLVLLLGLGIIVPFIFFNLFRINENNFEMLLVKFLFIIQVALAFFAPDYNLYFLKGAYLWAVIIAFDGIKSIFHKEHLRWAVLGLVFCIAIMTRIWTFNALLHVDKNNYFFFLKAEEGNVLHDIDKLPPGNMLSLFKMGNYIPAYSENRVYIGHAHQTPSSKIKLINATRFYTFFDKETRMKFIRTNNITYIYYGYEEADLRKELKFPTQNPFPEYKKVYQKNGIIIYQP